MASMTLKQIDASIKSIVRRGKALREDAHKTLVAIIEHHIEHGDYTKLALLHNAVKGSLGSSIGQALVQWVNDYYNGITWDKEAGAFVHVKGVDKAIKADVSYKSKDGTFTHEGDARGLPFYRLEKPVNQAPFDLKARILMLVTQAENARTKAIKDGKEAPVTKAALEAIKALSESYDSLKDEEPASKEAEETAKTLAVADQMKAEGEAKTEEAAPAPVVNKRKAAKAA